MTINKLNLPAKANAVQSKINEIIDNFPTGTVDQTFDGTSANAQSGVAINGELTSNYQPKLVSGTNIKTINNTSLLGSGNISLAGDNTTVNKNSDDELQTIGVIDDNVQNAYNFTVVGTPTITNDGIASGFSGSNYLVYSTFDTSKPWDIRFKFNCNKYDTMQGLIRLNAVANVCVMVRPNGTIFFRNQSVSSVADLSSDANFIQLNTDYICNIGWTGTMYYLKINNNLISSINSIGVTQLDQTYLGVGQSGYYSTTSNIDLKQFSITVDGVEVYRAWQPPALKYWIGTKAQYDAIATKNANTLYNVEGVGLYKGTTLISNNGVSKSGDTMTGSLNISTDIVGAQSFINLVNENITKGTNPTQNTYTTISFNDRTNDSSYVNTRMGSVECFVNANGTVMMSLAAIKNEVGSSIFASMQVAIDSSGNASCKFPNTTCVDGQYTETNETIVSSLNLNNANSSDTGWYTLSSLPDNGEYLCWIIGRGTTGSTSGNYIYCRVVSDIVTDYMTCCATRTRTASTVTSEGVICIPVKNKRVKIKRDANWDGTGLFILRGYRRIGTNS